MSQPSIECPYCGNNIFLRVITQGDSTSLSSEKGLGMGDTTTVQEISDEVYCNSCKNSYIYLNYHDYTVVKRSVRYSDTMLVTMKSMFPHVTVDDVMNSIIGVVRPKKGIFQWRDRLHICFYLNGKRAYIDCHKQKGVYNGLDVYEVIL